MIIFGRVVLFIVCLWFSLAPYAQALTYLLQFEPTSHDKWIAVPWLLLSCVVPAALVAGAVCLPIAWAFGRSAPWVALCLSAPFVALRFHYLRPNAKALELALACSSVVSYVLFVVGATMLASRFLKARRTGGNSGSPAVV
jgi:hypothetical protein